MRNCSHRKTFKLLLLVSRLRRSGPINGVYTLARHYVRDGLNVDVVALSETSKDSMLDEFKGLGVNVHTLGLSGSDVLKTYWALKESIDKNGYDIVHSTGFRPDLVTSVIKKRKGGFRCVSTVRSELYNDLKFNIGGTRAYAVTKLWSWALSRFDAVVPHSNGIRNALSSYGVHAPLHVIYNGVDTAMFSPPSDEERLAARHALGIADETVVIGHVGHLTILKGVNLIIEAISRIPRGMNFIFVSVGIGDQKEKLSALARSLRVEDRIIWAGRKEDVLPYLRAMDIFTLPSLTEGLPRALIEACATGLPAVVSDIPGSREVVDPGDNGLLFGRGDSEQLYKAIIKLVESEDLRKKMGKSSRLRAEMMFSAKSMAEGYKRLYHDLLTSCVKG